MIFNNVAKSLLVNVELDFKRLIIFSWVVSWVVLGFSLVVFANPLLSKGITTFINLSSKIYESMPIKEKNSQYLRISYT